MIRAGYIWPMAALVLALLNGCAALVPNSLLTECEHVSHPFAGPPFGPKSEEDSLNQCGVLGEWTDGAAYLHLGVGYVLTDGGFYGPEVTGTVRAGYRIPLRRARHE
jgi:hypothetical protein